MVRESGGTKILNKLGVGKRSTFKIFKKYREIIKDQNTANFTLFGGECSVVKIDETKSVQAKTQQGLPIHLTVQNTIGIWFIRLF